MTLLDQIAQAEAQAHLRFGASGAAAQFGPLAAVHAGPDLPVNAGWLDHSKPLTSNELQEFEDFCNKHGQNATLNVLSSKISELLPLLNKRHYQLDYILHLYAHHLENLPPLPNLDIRIEKNTQIWTSLAAQGFELEENTQEMMRLVAEAQDTQLFVGMLEGQDAGTGAFVIQNKIAAFHGTSTLPSFRQCGIQSALLAYRLHTAAQAGADLATVFVTPQTPSERNVKRAGFEMIGIRLTFTRH